MTQLCQSTLIESPIDLKVFEQIKKLLFVRIYKFKTFITGYRKSWWHIFVFKVIKKNLSIMRANDSENKNAIIFIFFHKAKIFFEGFLISRTQNSPITNLHHMHQGLTNILNLFGVLLGVTRYDYLKIFTTSSFFTSFIYKIMRNCESFCGTSTSWVWIMFFAYFYKFKK